MSTIEGALSTSLQQWIYNTFTTDACWSIYNTSFILQSDFSSTLLILQGLRHAQYPRSKLLKPSRQSERCVYCTVKLISQRNKMFQNPVILTISFAPNLSIGHPLIFPQVVTNWSTSWLQSSDLKVSTMHPESCTLH